LQLSAAADVCGIARGVAFQLVVGRGVLERQKVSEELKSLVQPSRATLRKYGVRFGAYHIYFPALLKPAPRALAVQLFALKNEGPDTKGLEALQQVATGGRTSMPADNEIARSLYRTAGYRVCGDRAVRVDILERLADLIRPALNWREGAPGIKPAGVYPGGGFTVTVGMTSLVGSSGESFASILRSLGYRLDRKPKPPEDKLLEAEEAKPPEPTAAQAADASVAATGPDADAPDHQAQPEQQASPDQQAQDVDAPPVEAEAQEAGAAPPESEAVAAPDDAAASSEPPVATAEPDSAVASPNSAEQAPNDAEQGAQEPEFVEVWRPGRSPEERRQQRERHQRRAPRRHHDGKAPAAAPAAPGAEAAVAESAKPQEKHENRRPRHGKGRRADWSDRPQRPDRKGGNRPAFAASSAPKERRDREPDPNSPFAKLAALKAQLEANKERQ
jgi:ATP-dependent RNA helicase SUPV3L1/SUV3